MCFRVETCCFITDLRRGTFAVAIISLLGNVVLLAYTSWAVNQGRLYLQYIPKAEESKAAIYQIFGKITTKSCVMLAIQLLVIILAIVMDVVLLFGVIKRRRDLLQSWLRVHVAVFGFYLFSFLQLAAGYFIYNFTVYGAITLVAVILGAGVTVCLWIVVHSYDLELRRKTSAAISSTHANFPASRQNGPDVEASPMVVRYTQA